MKRLLALCVLAMPACSLFSKDTAPAIDALRGVETTTARTYERIRLVLENVTNEAARAKLSAEFDAEERATKQLLAAVLEWVEAVGEVDWKTLYKELKK